VSGNTGHDNAEPYITVPLSLATPLHITLQPNGIPYSLQGSVDVGHTLTLLSGVTIEAPPGYNGSLSIAGTLQSLGTKPDDIRITAADSVPGSWRSIYATPGAVIDLQGTTLSYGGNAYPLYTQGVINATGASVSLTDCRITDSFGAGIHATDTSVLLTRTQIANITAPEGTPPAVPVRLTGTSTLTEVP
jgi:hypothetical protein